MATLGRRIRLLLFAASVALFAGACSDETPERSADGELVSPGVLLANQLEVGDCLGTIDPTTTELEKVDVVPCTDNHTIEVLKLLQSSDAQYPGEAALQAFADVECLGAFGAYVGIDYFVPGNTLYYSYLYPTFDSWHEGNDRTIICVVGSAATLNGSVEGVGLNLPAATG